MTHSLHSIRPHVYLLLVQYPLGLCTDKYFQMKTVYQESESNPDITHYCQHMLTKMKGITITIKMLTHKQSVGYLNIWIEFFHGKIDEIISNLEHVCSKDCFWNLLPLSVP